jgi:CheY-like chemotaxis protein
MKEAESIKQFKVLLVTDNPVILILSANILKKAGYEVLEATTGKRNVLLQCTPLILTLSYWI